MTGVVLTVIIPAYNAEKYLPQCLDSVIGQTLKDIEVIASTTARPTEALPFCRRIRKKIPGFPF